METEEVSYALAMSRRDREPPSSDERIRRSSIVEIPARPGMRYGRMRRQRVMKELRRGRLLAAEDMPVAGAVVDQQRSQQRWFVFFSCLLAVSSLLRGFQDHGFMRWALLGLTACWVISLPLLLREQRKLVRNYERQRDSSTVGDHPNDVIS
jgi:hypothetical protein